jgi:hypothetical protein
MKTVSDIYPLLSTVLLLVAVSSAGCDSTGMQRAKMATTTMETMENDIKAVATQLDAVGGSLDQLLSLGQSDVKKAFNLYTERVAKIESMEIDFAKHADEMKARGKDYFEEWQKEGDNYTSPQIQELSEQRRTELGEIYGKIAEASIGVRDAFKAYVSDTKEIQHYLSNDLTSKGIEAIAPIAGRVVHDGDNLKYAIKNVQAAIERARAEMSQSGR